MSAHRAELLRLNTKSFGRKKRYLYSSFTAAVLIQRAIIPENTHYRYHKFYIGCIFYKNI